MREWRGGALGADVANLVVPTVGGLAVLLGAIAVAGWHAAPGRVNSAFGPMGYDDGICFVLCGASLLAMRIGWPRVAALCGGITATLAALTLIGPVVDLNLSIGELLMEPQPVIATAPSGSMAPNAALAFLLTGIAFCAAARSKRVFGYLIGTGVVVFALGVVPFAGYLGAPTPSILGVGRLTRMATHTAGGVSALGLALLSLAWRVASPPDIATSGGAERQRRMVMSVSVLIVIVVAASVQLGTIQQLSQAALVDCFSHLGAVVGEWREVLIAETDSYWTDSSGEGPNGRTAARSLREREAGAQSLAAIGDSAEVLVGHRESGELAVLLLRPDEMSGAGFPIPPLGVRAAAAMRGAIGGEEGTLLGLDYDGTQVLIAYGPAGPKGWGLVAKVDLVEIQAPFVTASWLAAGIGLLLSVAGAAALLVTIDPTIRGMAERTAELQRQIAERESAEEGLRQYQQAVASSPDMVALLDRRYVYLVANDAYVRAFDKATGAVVGRTVAQVFGEEFFETVIRPKADRCLAGEKVSYQAWFEFPLTGRRHMDVAYAPYRGLDGEILGFVVSGRDVTEHHHMEEAKSRLEALLRQQQKLEAIGTLAGGVAHEINNPIHGIMNYAQLINDRLDPENSLREFAEGIDHEARRVASIVSNLLAFARQDKQSRSPTRIQDVLEDTLSLVGMAIERDQIELVVDLPADLPQIMCRAQQIQQVLMNLLTNARDALNHRYPGADPNKTLTITARPFSREHRRWVRIAVEDHGAGISDEVRFRLFEPFFTTKDRGQIKGTGLGLAISHGIVREHHGELRFESDGVSFTRCNLELPVDKGSALVAGDEEAEVAEG